MSGVTLTGCTILVVEDEFLAANAVCQSLRAAGATVVGPAATAERGLRLLERTDRVDAAVLDINLRGAKDYTMADALRARAVPFVFTTGHTKAGIPRGYQGVEVLHKPLDHADLLAILSRLTRYGERRFVRGVDTVAQGAFSLAD